MQIVTCPNCGAKNRVDPSRSDLQAVCGKCKTPLKVGAVEDDEPREFTDDSFDHELAAAGSRPVLVDAWAAWCPPCRALSPTIAAIAKESHGRWIVGKVNIDENPRTAGRFRIGSIPTLLIFRDAQLVEQLVGLQPKEAIVAALQKQA